IICSISFSFFFSESRFRISSLEYILEGSVRNIFSISFIRSVIMIFTFSLSLQILSTTRRDPSGGMWSEGGGRRGHLLHTIFPSQERYGCPVQDPLQYIQLSSSKRQAERSRAYLKTFVRQQQDRLRSSSAA